MGSRHSRLDRGSRANTNEIPSQAEDDAPRQLLQIHDSIIVECKESQTEEVEKLLIEIMENIYTKLPVKLKVDVKSGKTWGDL